MASKLLRGIFNVFIIGGTLFFLFYVIYLILAFKSGSMVGDASDKGVYVALGMFFLLKLTLWARGKM